MLIEDEHGVAVTYRVVAVSVGHIAVIRDAVALAELCELTVTSAQADKATSEESHIALEHRPRVARGIDRHKENAYPSGAWPHEVQRLRKGRKRCRARVGAMCVAEIKQYDFAAIAFASDELAILIGQREVEMWQQSGDVVKCEGWTGRSACADAQSEQECHEPTRHTALPRAPTADCIGADHVAVSGIETRREPLPGFAASSASSSRSMSSMATPDIIAAGIHVSRPPSSWSSSGSMLQARPQTA
jgi:hypothetical protein